MNAQGVDITVAKLQHSLFWGVKAATNDNFLQSVKISALTV